MCDTVNQLSVLQTKCLTTGWSITFKVRLFSKRCDTSTMPWFIALVVPARVVDSDAVVPESGSLWGPAETTLDVNILHITLAGI